MGFKLELSEDETFHFNYGLPIVLGLILFIINAEIFAIKFLEPFIFMLKFYSYSSLLIVFLLIFLTKKNKENKRNVVVSYYDLFVHNSVLVLIFLIMNLSFSHSIYESNTPFNQEYKRNVYQLDVPIEYEKLYSISHEEYKNYYGKGYRLQVKIAESFFGYRFIKQRKFVR